jgi:hypothetical protein
VRDITRVPNLPMLCPSIIVRTGFRYVLLTSTIDFHSAFSPLPSGRNSELTATPVARRTIFALTVTVRIVHAFSAAVPINVSGRNPAELLRR